MLNKHNLYRLQTMMVLCIMLFVVLLGRLVYLQLWRGDYYSKQSDGNRLRQSRIIAPRGLILDKDGKEDQNASRRVEFLFRLKDDEMINDISDILNN